MVIVIAQTDILPEEVLDDKELKALCNKVLDAIKPLNTKIENIRFIDVAYGLKKISCNLVIPEGLEGGTQPVEDAIAAVEGVQRVEIGAVSRM